MDDAPLPLPLPQRYAVERRLGRGGTSTVYLATDRLLQRRVAIKVFTAHADSAGELQRQEAEAKLIASLNHYALTTLLDAGVDATDPARPRIYLVMEYVPGTDLRHRLREGPLAWLEVCWLGLDLGEGLAAVHERGFLHRDITPANILLAAREADTRIRAKLTDFGVAALLGSAGSTATGTAAYLSPEQAAGAPATAASDVYSLGLVLREALGGGDAPEALTALLGSMTGRHAEDRPALAEVTAAFQDLLVDELVRQRAPRRARSADAEEARLEAVRRYSILDTPPEERYDRVTRLAARALRTPIAAVAILDAERVWFKSRHGLPVTEFHRPPGMWTSADQRGAWSVSDTLLDPTTTANPLVGGNPAVRSLAAAPLLTPDGYTLGVLCVVDVTPRDFTEADMATLRDLAGVVMNEMELRLATRRALFGE